MSTLKSLGYFLVAVCILLATAVGAIFISLVVALVKAVALFGAAIVVVVFCLKAYFESVPSSKDERESRGSQEGS